MHHAVHEKYVEVVYVIKSMRINKDNSNKKHG